MGYALHDFKEKRAHKARDMQFFLQVVQNEIFKILECQNKKQRQQHHAHNIFILSLLLVIIAVEL